MTGTWLDRNRNLIFAILLLLAGGGAGFFYLQKPTPGTVEIVPLPATATPAPTPAPTPTSAPVRVYITGAVVNSDVYFLPPGSIVKDAIIAAGGFTPDANKEGINQALEIQDQQQIHVPRQGETDAPPPVQGGLDEPKPASRSLAPAAVALINLNTATVEELDSLPGIGPAIAKRIIDYRESAGGFKDVEQITEVSGIGEATLAKIKDLITVQ